jgi:hypothetical protein
MPKPLGRRMIAPTKAELADLLDAIELPLSSLMRRWGDGISPEARVEITTDIYEPVLRMLIRLKRRPIGHSRSGT